MMTGWRTSSGLLALSIEARLFFRQRFIAVMLLAFAVLCMLAAADGIHRIGEQRQTIRKLAEGEQKRLDAAAELAARLDQHQAVAGPFRDPRVASNFTRIVLSTPAVKRLFPAASLDAGQADTLPFYFLLNTGSAIKSTTTYEYSNPQQLMLGRFDLSLVLIYILPLILALFAYRIGSFEREAGITPLLQIALPRLFPVYGRRIGLAALPLLMVYSAVAVVVLAVESHLDHGSGGLLWQSMLRLLLMEGLYVVFWSCVLLVLAMTSVAPVTALLQFTATWLTVCVLVPALASQLALTLYPTMSRPEYVNRVRAANDALLKDPHRLYSLYLVQHPELGVNNAILPSTGVMALITTEMTDRAGDTIAAELEHNQRRQEQVVRWASIASPALVLQRQIDELAGEDQGRELLFRSAARKHIQTLRTYYFPRVSNSEPLAEPYFDQLMQYPRFAW